MPDAIMKNGARQSSRFCQAALKSASMSVPAAIIAAARHDADATPEDAPLGDATA